MYIFKSYCEMKNNIMMKGYYPQKLQIKINNVSGVHHLTMNLRLNTNEDVLYNMLLLSSDSYLMAMNLFIKNLTIQLQ